MDTRRAPSQAPAPTAVRKAFEQLTATHPTQRMVMETRPEEKLGRWMDLLTPIGRGQRCLIVAPPKTGKTTLLKTISQALTQNHPEVVQLVLLVDERPEEVTDFERSVKAKVVASSSDKSTENHIARTRGVLEEAMQAVLDGRDAIILLDSITRLARAFNLHSNSNSKTLSGGLGAQAMQEPRQFFGAARYVENGGSLTVVATALIETGSRMDDVIFQEFKGTGNMELVLSRDLAEKRCFPAINIRESGTRKEELLYPEDQYRGLVSLRQIMSQLSPDDAFRMVDKVLTDFRRNQDLLLQLGSGR
ncbi:MAG: transcription termination factor Rho [Candidatus Lindowbacteria bacterium RIFCSPLOWO2_12_FULL_62_27]|nr:MAG: transcription termination factor Rho [Candidatus Lindowbacteria bacterium RIFCSPLOWO2_12_FULL_62_27]OGH61606.1 MAG: transcription termination factor Rho [Candidatus Lindowbacteria bacterium RIFCSPLOWO2_02_FULL_62_12]